MECERRHCHARVAVRCEDCGGPVRLPLYRTEWRPLQDSDQFYGMLVPTPCARLWQEAWDPHRQAELAIKYVGARYSGEGWRRYVREDDDGAG